MKRFLPVYILCILLTSSLTGCWDRRELDTLAIVQAFGIDETKDGQVIISAQILKPGEVKGEAAKGGQGVWVVTSTGETVFDAIRNAAFKSARKLYFSHNKVIILGEETAKKGIDPLLDFLDRDPEPRRISNIFIARGLAQDILLGEHEQERVPGEAIEKLAKTSNMTSHLPERDLNDLFQTLSSQTSSSVVPGIKIIHKNEKDTPKEVVSLDQTAIFKKDKLIGWFNETETRGLLWVLGEVKSGIIVIKSPQEETKNISLEIIRASSQLKPKISEGQLKITVEVKVEANLGEQMSEVNLTKPDTFAELEKRQTAAIEDEIHAALNKAQVWGVDIFKFGEEFHRKYPEEWPELEKKWEEEFPKIEVSLEVISNLRRIGLTTIPIKAEESQP